MIGMADPYEMPMVSRTKLMQKQAVTMRHRKGQILRQAALPGQRRGSSAACLIYTNASLAVGHHLAIQSGDNIIGCMQVIPAATSMLTSEAWVAENSLQQWAHNVICQQPQTADARRLEKACCNSCLVSWLTRITLYQTVIAYNVLSGQQMVISAARLPCVFGKAQTNSLFMSLQNMRHSSRYTTIASDQKQAGAGHGMDNGHHCQRSHSVG